MKQARPAQLIGKGPLAWPEFVVFRFVQGGQLGASRPWPVRETLRAIQSDDATGVEQLAGAPV